jgi:hypothetical protein
VGMWYDLQAGVDPPMVRENSSSLDLSCYDIVGIIGMQASRSAIYGRLTSKGTQESDIAKARTVIE